MPVEKIKKKRRFSPQPGDGQFSRRQSLHHPYYINFFSKRRGAIQLGKPLYQTLKNQSAERTPIWFMRQAGRYLPEYRQVRQKFDHFLDFCLSPEEACEVTLQPLRRFDLDAAILFADILLIPHALGQPVAFKPGEGPLLSPIALNALKYDPQKLSPIYETIQRVKERLDPEKTLIGFCGAPWTVATYMLEGQGSKTYPKTKMFAYQQPEVFQEFLNLLADTSAHYLIQQIHAGADTVKIFDSWAGVVPAEHFHDWVIAPTRRLVNQVRQACPDTPIMGFPKGAGLFYQDYLKTGVDALTLDPCVPRLWARETLMPHAILQGGLDPLVVAAGGKTLDAHIDALCAAFLHQGRYIFNLGHGFIPETPLEHVSHVIERVRSF